MKTYFLVALCSLLALLGSRAEATDFYISTDSLHLAVGNVLNIDAKYLNDKGLGLELSAYKKSTRNREANAAAVHFLRGFSISHAQERWITGNTSFRFIPFFSIGVGYGRENVSGLSATQDTDSINIPVGVGYLLTAGIFQIGSSCQMSYQRQSIRNSISGRSRNGGALLLIEPLNVGVVF